jgi:hypothetical protein
MADQMTAASGPAGTLGGDLGAFFRHLADASAGYGSALLSALCRLRGSDDPIVTFGQLPRACVPHFADGCQIELSDGSGPSLRITSEADLNTAAPPASPDRVLVTPFRALSLASSPSYAGVVTYWWTSRTPDDRDAVASELIVARLTALVEHERLLAAVARAEDRAADLALQAITSRTINLAIGVVMHQKGVEADAAEQLLRETARTGVGLHDVAARVVRSGTLRCL